MNKKASLCSQLPFVAFVLIFAFLITPACYAQTEKSSLQVSPDTNTIVSTLRKFVEQFEQQAREMLNSIKNTRAPKHVISQKKTEVTIECPKGGNAKLSGSLSLDRATRKINLQGGAELIQCNAWDGMLSLGGVARLSKGKALVTTDVNGDVTGKTCFREQRLRGVADITFESIVQSEAQKTSTTLSGSLTYSCGAIDLITCSWNRVNTRDKQALKAGCK